MPTGSNPYSADATAIARKYDVAIAIVITADSLRAGMLGVSIADDCPLTQADIPTILRNAADAAESDLPLGRERSSADTEDRPIMPLDQAPDALIVAILREIEELDAGGYIPVGFTPANLLMVVSAVQLASRHPHFPPTHRIAARHFIIAARTAFRDCPSVLRAIALGDDPANDVRA